MLRRALAPLVLVTALAAPSHADPVPAAVTHGYVKVYVQHFRCNLYSYQLTGSFQVGTRTWRGTASTAACLFEGAINDPTQTTSDLSGTSPDGVLTATCINNVVMNLEYSDQAPDPAVFDCQASLNGSRPLPLVLEVKTHPVTDPDRELYLEKTGSFYGA